MRALVNARILPMATPRWPSASEHPWEQEAEAILFGARVEQVGTNTSVTAEARRRGVQVEDMHGATIVPGFVDAHTHFLHIGVKLTRPDLAGCRDLAECLARVQAWLATHPGPEPVIGELWDESSWPGRIRPSRADLDVVVQHAAMAGHGPTNRMVVLRRVCGHVAVANTAALAAVRKRWPDREHVDPETGILLEQPSLYLNEVIPVSPEGLDRALQAACAKSHALGITAVGDYSQAPYRDALQRAAGAGTLTVRVASSIYTQQLEAEVAGGMRTGRWAPGPDGAPSPWLRDGGLKVFLDGSLGGRTAALRSRYLDADPKLAADCGGTPASRHGCVGHAHPNGTLNWGDADVGRLFRRAHGAGIQIHAHAIGDAAIDQGLEAFAKILGPSGPGWGGAAVPASSMDGIGTELSESTRATDPRHRFEHYEIHHDDQVAATARLGIVASSQPNFVGTWSAKGGMYEERLGARYRLGNRFRTLKEAGVRIAFGSDGMPPGPLPGIAAAVHHPDPVQRMGWQESVWHYTWASAWALFWEDAIGSLEPGKWADLVVLDRVSDEGTGWRLRDTFVGGVPRTGTGTQ